MIVTMKGKLRKLYNKYFELLRTKFGTTEKLHNPLLINLPKNYEGSKKRVMLIGTNTPKSRREPIVDTIEDCQGLYEKLGLYPIEKANFIKELSKELFGEYSLDNIVYTNIFKTTECVHYDNSIPGRYESCKSWREMNFEITRKEIEILKPDFIIFCTGDGSFRNDSYYVDQLLGFGGLFIPIKEQKEMALVYKLKTKLDYTCCRIPEFPIKDDKEIIQILTKLISKHD